MKISFIADKIDIGKKKIDGTRTVVIDVGEYEHDKLAPILTIPEDVTIKVTLEY